MALYGDHPCKEKIVDCEVIMRFPYQKLLIVGNGGAGKSTFARYLSERFSLPAVHLDKLWWLSGWVNRSQEEFDELLEFELAKQKWIIEGNFRRTFLKRLQACDGAIMLDIPPEQCLQSVYRRAEMYRVRTRTDMTEGCEEEVHEDFIKWITDEYPNCVRGEMMAIMQESGKPFLVFSSREEAYAWADGYKKA